MKNQKFSKKKVVTGVVATVMAAALLLGGTFAWQSISQTALNETGKSINPGGRLHDDFDGSNKDIYVENFADENIFARVRLDEYFEVIVNKGTAAESVKVITAGATKGDTSTYVTHKFDSENVTDNYWNWTTGGRTKYMPTFNKNKDSLSADINGTYEQNFDDYVDYNTVGSKEDGAVYDTDENDIEDAGVLTIIETHYAKDTEAGSLISMSEWLQLLENGENTSNYWVYDTDGWVYWSSPIAGDSATGLLLDKIQLSKVMDDSYYYAINAVAQFITADDSGKWTGTGFYTDDSLEPSYNAERLLEAIGVSDVSYNNYKPAALKVTPKITSGKSWYAEYNAETFDLSVSATYNNKNVDASSLENVTWSIEGNTSNNTKLTNNTGATSTLSVADDETGTIVVSAKLKYKEEQQKGYVMVSNGPSVGSMALFTQSGEPVSAKEEYVAGTDNEFVLYYFEEYKGDVTLYRPEDAYTGEALNMLLSDGLTFKIVDYDYYSGEPDEKNIEGVTLVQDNNKVTLKIDDGVTEQFGLYVSGAMITTYQFVPTTN